MIELSSTPQEPQDDRPTEQADAAPHEPRRIARPIGSGSPPPPKQHRELNLFAAVLAWLWPGLGHISLGEKKRGLLIMFGVLFLFFSGLLVGGVSAVDRREERLWFLAQGLCGPIAFGADALNQSVVKPMPPERGAIALAHVSEISTLFIALAGLMNLVVMLDALHFMPKPPPAQDQPRRRADDVDNLGENT